MKGCSFYHKRDPGVCRELHQEPRAVRQNLRNHRTPCRRYRQRRRAGSGFGKRKDEQAAPMMASAALRLANMFPRMISPWTNSNWSANCRAVTIEVSNSSGAPNWEVSDTSLQTLVKLVADIARRNGLFPLVVGKTLTYHSMYIATALPRAVSEKQIAMAFATKRISWPICPRTVQARTSSLRCASGPASAGDVLTLKQMAEDLSVPFAETDGFMTIGGMSKGDVVTFTQKADELGLPVQTAAEMVYCAGRLF